MRQRSTWRWAALGLVAIVVVAGAWCGWQTWRVYRDLSAAASSAADLQAAVEADDDAATDSALAQLTERSSSAAGRTGGTTWSVLERVPWLGDDAQGIRVVSTALSDLSQTGIEPLVATAKDLEVLLPRDGAIPVDRIAALRDPVATGSAAFDQASDELATEDPRSFLEPLRLKYRELTGQVDDAARVLRTTNTALQIMPAMLGADGPRNYLLVFQNNAEIRATGGLPGAVSLLQADGGRVELTRQVAASTLGETSAPVLPLTPAEKELYGDQLGTYFLDANFTPDFPRTADLMKARWEQEYPDALDGVLSIDPVALSYVLAATGPVQVGDLTLSSDNVVGELLNQVYIDRPDPVAQDEFFRAVALAVFTRVTSGVDSPTELLRGLARAASEHRLYVHLFGDDQQKLTGTTVAGELTPADDSHPLVGVFLNDATGAKMSFYLRFDAQVNAVSCVGGVQGLTGRARLRSEAPLDAATLPEYITGGGTYGIDPGTQLVIVRLYGPQGGAVTDVQLQDMPVDTDTVQQDGRPVASVVVQLAPAETLELTWRMDTGSGQTGAVQMSATPGVETGRTWSAGASACS